MRKGKTNEISLISHLFLQESMENNGEKLETLASQKKKMLIILHIYPQNDSNCAHICQDKVKSKVRDFSINYKHFLSSSLKTII